MNICILNPDIFNNDKGTKLVENYYGDFGYPGTLHNVRFKILAECKDDYERDVLECEIYDTNDILLNLKELGVKKVVYSGSLKLLKKDCLLL